jgi:hypothetical protein|nr:beta-propeller domain-containing protein [Kofleriaceae bacterium]
MRLASVLTLAAALPLAASCGNDKDRSPGQTSFISSPLPSQQGLANAPGAGGEDGGGAGAGSGGGGATPTSSDRTVEETDLYRLEGTRLYYLNGYRGLMVFDVSNPDTPKLLGRSPIFGSPVDMVVNEGVATVVVADFYDINADGTPFYGSIVRGLDATDPANIKVLGDAHLGGWVSDDRVVGSVLYAVSEDWGYYGDYGWWPYAFGCGDCGGAPGAGVGGGGADVHGASHGRGYGLGGATSNTAAGGRSAKTHRKSPNTSVSSGNTDDSESVIVSSVSFANKQIKTVSSVSYDGYGGVFNVTPSSILLAHPADDTSETSQLVYLDISDPNGAIVQRGSVTIDGMVQGWGADNGRWNIDFADGITAHAIAETYEYNSGQNGYVISTADFTNPDAPKVVSQLAIASPGWGVAARFDSGRLYLSPSDGWYDGTDTTPFQVYDLTTPANPFLAGTVTIHGNVWNILPAPNGKLFALGNDWNSNTDSVELQYLDVTNPAQPTVLGDQSFGGDWAWTPAAGTFKAFTMDATKGLVVLPYSGWDYNSEVYNNGLQLVQFNDTSEQVSGAAHTKGWVERGIFVGTRLVSLSDMALAVVDYSDPTNPSVITEMTLARNVFTAQPVGSSIAEVSSDWWQNDVATSEVRVLPIAQAAETTDQGNVPTVTVDGVGASVFTNGNLSYIVTDKQVAEVCPGGDPSQPPQCYGRSEKVTVVDVSTGKPTTRGSIELPADEWDWWGWGWYGFWWYDWFDGAAISQVETNALAFRRWEPVFDGSGNYIDSNSDLYVVDLSNPDAPKLASTTITVDPDGWWGNMQVVGDTLYTTHEEWVEQGSNGDQSYVRYYADRIDLTDRSHPVIENKINVPGLIVGGDATHPSTVYTIDYRWDSSDSIVKNDFDVVSLGTDVATLESSMQVDGWVGNVFVRNKTAYMSSQLYDWNSSDSTPAIELHAIDVSDPGSPVDRIASGGAGWGWLLDVEGDRALVTSGWSGVGIDIYQLPAASAPVYEQTVRTNGWWVNGVSRQGNQLFLASGYWGVQTVNLQ